MRKVDSMSDLVFLAFFGSALVLSAHLYAVTGWPMPGLIDKT